MAFTKNIALKDITKVPREASKAYVKAGQQVMKQMAKAVLAQLKLETQAHQAIDTERYLKGWKITEGRGRFSINITNDAPYAVFIELGRGSGTTPPPRAPITRWVMRKFGKPYTEAKRLAHVISQSIGQNGVPGKPVMGRAVEHVTPKLVLIVKAAMLDTDFNV